MEVPLPINAPLGVKKGHIQERTTAVTSNSDIEVPSSFGWFGIIFPAIEGLFII